MIADVICVDSDADLKVTASYNSRIFSSEISAVCTFCSLRFSMTGLYECVWKPLIRFEMDFQEMDSGFTF